MISRRSPQELHARARSLIAAMPDLTKLEMTNEKRLWLSGAYALCQELLQLEDANLIKFETAYLGYAGHRQKIAVNRITECMFRALATAEMKNPDAVTDAFIAVGDHFSALASVNKILQQADKNCLVVDPYLSGQFVIDFLPFYPADKPIRLLTTSREQESLKPAITIWNNQHSGQKVECRIAPKRSIHDRLILIDDKKAWVVTQSFKDIAKHAPASISAVDDSLVELKSEAYADIWNAAVPLALP